MTVLGLHFVSAPSTVLDMARKPARKGEPLTQSESVAHRLMVTEGADSRRIARELRTSESSARLIVGRVLTKCGAADRARLAVAWWREYALVDEVPPVLEADEDGRTVARPGTAGAKWRRVMSPRQVAAQREGARR